MASATNATPQKTSHPFTCVTCAIAFRSSDLQRGHMRSDWHRYNLKRRVASLPPLSSEVFAEKVLSAQATSKAAAEKASFEKTCQACEKTYFSEGAFRNHLGSQRHRMKLAALQAGPGVDDASSVTSVMSSTISLGEPIRDDDSVEEDFQDVIKGIKGADLSDDDLPSVKRAGLQPQSKTASSTVSTRSNGAETPSVADTADTMTSTAMPIQRCMFCNYDSEDLDANILHMTRQHGLFLPEQDYLDDVEGLISYMQAKVTEYCECLFCHRLKNTVSGIQTHMRDKGHCMIAFETEEEMLEVGQFYDFRATYSDSEEESSDEEEESDSEQAPKSRGVKLGAARATKSGGEDEEWESDGDEETSEDDEDGPQATKRTQRSAGSGAYIADGELYLPSGRQAGHREFRRYFRQNLRGYPTPSERAEQQKLLESGEHDEDGEGDEQDSSNNRDRRVATRNKNLGIAGLSDAAKRQLRVREQKDQHKAQTSAWRMEMKVQRKANNQKHFRDDNFGIKA